MDTALWAVQGLLAFMFIMAGAMKLATPKHKLEEKQPWAKNFSEEMIKFIGASEFAGGIGLVVPMLLNTVGILTPIAAIGLAIVMLLAANVHLGRKEHKEIAVNFILFMLCAFVAYGRFGLM
ncbi:MAG: DoxX family protein [Bacteroidetes bacterium]|nr:DoxX family protein [Bacteroidota bacterium]